MKNFIKSLISEKFQIKIRRIRLTPNLIRAFFYDLARYSNFSAHVTYTDSEEKLKAEITAAYHNIEKGLALRRPRLGFAKINIEKLVNYINLYLLLYGSKPYLSTPLTVLNMYIEYHEAQGYNVDYLKPIVKDLQFHITSADKSLHGGVMKVSKEYIIKSTASTGLEFFQTRHSSRQFITKPLTLEEIYFATHAAQKSPVVCNRQSGRIHAFSKSEDIKAIVDLQGGARGFIEDIPSLFCITSDIRNFHGIGERYQAWIDGGLFASSFLFGLHAQGIGACCLNWSKDALQDQAMRSLINLGDSETIIMFIAAGHLPDQLTVAKSVRRPMDEVLSIRSGLHA